MIASSPTSNVPSDSMAVLLQTPAPMVQEKVKRKQVKSIMKRTPNAWTIFLNGNRVRVTKKVKGQPDVSNVDSASTASTASVSGKDEIKRLAGVWKGMGDDKKQPYKDQSTTRRTENKVRYRSLSASDKEIVKRFKTENPRKQNQVSPYMMYVKTEGGAIIKKHGIKEGGKLLGKTWKEMTPEKKSSFLSPKSSATPIALSTTTTQEGGSTTVRDDGDADSESASESDLEEGEIAGGGQSN